MTTRRIGNDNDKKQSWRSEVLRPTLRKSAKDGAPDRVWLAEENNNSKDKYGF